MGSLGMTANHFGVANCTAFKVVFEVCSTIFLVLGPWYLHLPRDQWGNENESCWIWSKFWDSSGICFYKWYTYPNNGSIYKFARLLQL